MIAGKFKNPPEECRLIDRVEQENVLVEDRLYYRIADIFPEACRLPVELPDLGISPGCQVFAQTQGERCMHFRETPMWKANKFKTPCETLGQSAFYEKRGRTGQDDPRAVLWW